MHAQEVSEVLLEADQVEERGLGPEGDEQVQVAVRAGLATGDGAEDPDVGRPEADGNGQISGRFASISA